MSRDGFKPFVGTGGRGEKNGRELYAGHFCKILASLFDDEICHQYTVNPCGSAIVSKPLHAIVQNRIQITEDYEAGRRSRGANLMSQLKHVREPRSTGHCPLAGSLNHRPGGPRIAE